jgi:phosphatidylglycerol:prolipoprotein diacylglycerol transferase
MQTLAVGGLGAGPLEYIILNINPILVQLGPFAIHWYGLAYVVAISVALWFVLRWTRREGIHDDQTWAIFVWAAIAGLIGGRLYFVIQQPDLVQHYLMQPLNIIAVWNGGMAFFGAIFLASATIFALAPRYGVDRFIILDAGALFAAIGQIFGRFGNIINGDILGTAASAGPVALPPGVCEHAPCIASVADAHILPWAVVYTNPGSFAPLGIAFQPAPVYEMIINLIALAILWPLRHYLPRVKAGMFFLLYLALYAIGQFIVFFFRGSEPFTPFLGIDTLKQAQWTAIFVLIACIPLGLLIWRFSRAWPFSGKHPVPWPLPAGGLATARADTAPPGDTLTALPVSDPVSPAARPMARSSAAAGAPVARSAVAPASAPAAPPERPTVELPPWQPHRPLNGALRNNFGNNFGVRRQPVF